MPTHMTNRLMVPVLDFARSRNIPVWDGSLTEDLTDNWFFEQVPKMADPSINMIVYGSVGWMRRFLDFPMMRRRIFYNGIHFDCSNWKDIYQQKWMNHAGYMADVIFTGIYLRKKGPHHVRPVYNDKAVVGGVYDADLWDKTVTERNVRETETFWLSPLLEIQAEYRCWIVNNRIVEISQYRRDGQFETKRITDPEIFLVAELFKNEASLHSCYVMDLALVQDEWKLIEFNPIHCSGWYAADVEHILDEWIKMYEKS